MQKILIVVDMQNDFVTGSLGSEAAQVAAKNIAAHINEYDTVIFTRDTHGPDYLETLEGKFLPVPHCIKDTEGWEIIPELVNGVSKVKNLYVVDKDTFGTFIWGSMSAICLWMKILPLKSVVYAPTFAWCLMLLSCGPFVLIRRLSVTKTGAPVRVLQHMKQLSKL